jgi:hypothetical protein
MSNTEPRAPTEGGQHSPERPRTLFRAVLSTLRPRLLCRLRIPTNVTADSDGT